MRQSKNESTWFLMFHRCLALFVWMCVLWTGTFMHDISDLQFETKDAVAISHHGHHHGHSHAHHDHDHGHVHDEHCGHSHGPTPSELAGPGGWRRGFAAILTVGIRPCSGAILVLVFALAQGLFWAGVAATFLMGLGTAITVAAIAVIAVSAKEIAQRLSAGRDGGGALFMRGVEFGAAGLVLLFGVGLLFGYIAAERTTCF